MAIDDFINVCGIDVAIPGAFRVDHQDRTLGAAVKAARPVGPNFPRAMGIGGLKPRLGMGMSIGCTKFGTAFGTAIALVDTEKNMTFKIRHTAFYVAYRKPR